MATSEAKEIKKQETLVRFNIISYKTRLRVIYSMSFLVSTLSLKSVKPAFAGFTERVLVRKNIERIGE